MKRLFLVLAALALVASACAGSTVEESFSTVAGDETPATTPSSAAVSEDPTDPTSSTSPADGDVAAEEAKPLPEGPTAPDFTLALEPSGEFVLSQEVKPVYMIFWAEW
jgi:hypothetical protein